MTDSYAYTIKILSGVTKSAALKMPATYFLASLILPAITTSTAITFEVSMDGITYVPLHDGSGAAYSVTIDNTIANAVSLDPIKFYSWEYVKLVVADAQSGDKEIKMIVRTY
jgi:hypothetical protein